MDTLEVPDVAIEFPKLGLWKACLLKKAVVVLGDEKIVLSCVLLNDLTQMLIGFIWFCFSYPFDSLAIIAPKLLLLSKGVNLIINFTSQDIMDFLHHRDSEEDL